MTSRESRRLNLYNGLTDLLGAEQADTLMDYLPTTENSELATAADIHGLGDRIDHLAVRVDHVAPRIDAVEARLNTVESNLVARIDALGTRIDRVVFAMIAALVVIIAQGFF